MSFKEQINIHNFATNNFENHGSSIQLSRDYPGAQRIGRLQDRQRQGVQGRRGHRADDHRQDAVLHPMG